MAQQQAANTQYEKMTGEPIGRLILSLALPAVLSMLITNVYNIVDTAFVGRLGTSASGAVGIVFGFMAIIQAFGFMFGQGSGSIISRALGQKDLRRASIHASLGFVSAFTCGIVISVVCFSRLDQIVVMLGSTPTIAPYAKTYISFILLAAPFMCSSFTLNNLLQMQSGLGWDEDYGARSDVNLMLHREQDMGLYALSKPLAYEPGTHWYYSSGTTNIVMRYLRSRFSSDEVFLD